MKIFMSTLLAALVSFFTIGALADHVGRISTSQGAVLLFHDVEKPTLSSHKMLDGKKVKYAGHYFRVKKSFCSHGMLNLVLYKKSPHFKLSKVKVAYVISNNRNLYVCKKKH